MFNAPRICIFAIAAGTLLVFPTATLATDVDGGDDCQRQIEDWGDAPEGSDAYAGVIGRFPTCSTPGPVGTQEASCTPISSLPGPAGFVRHVSVAGLANYWLGCGAVGTTPLGVDSERDGKTNSSGNSVSFCSELLVDCVEPAFGLNFGQDECTGSNDAGLISTNLVTCAPSTVTFATYNCSADTQHVWLNVLVDWNHDGDWNDNLFCDEPAQLCAYEWAVKNLLIAIAPGCDTLTSPAFTGGPVEGDGWMRITISDEIVTDDFPWLGSAGAAGDGFLKRGETEDYPVKIGSSTSACPEYQDFGDAPEEFMAYPGIPGHFPTCAFSTGPGTQEIACPPLSTPPGPTGYVRHVRHAGDPAVWLGCTAVPPGSVDSETDGKSNDDGSATSMCSQIPVDCVENAFGMQFGQDECYGDTDAGVAAPVQFTSCDTTRVRLSLYNCGAAAVVAYVNVLVDWNRDGDWNDNFFCDETQQQCAYEWALKNFAVTLAPGCTPLLTPAILAGPYEGEGWMRVTVTLVPVSDNFPWEGSESPLIGTFTGGETEDYPVTIAAPTACDFGYQDMGDAPEDINAYPSGTLGRFPTCFAPGPVGSIDIACGDPLGTSPGPAGYVRHVVPASDTTKFWLGCGSAVDPSLGVDGEIDGKVNIGGGNSACDAAQLVDCVENLGLVFGQDECYGDLDAGLVNRLAFGACSTQTVTFNAYSCATVEQKVYLNVLIDWNQDGDWNDNAICFHRKVCTPEWAVKNESISLIPGCGTYSTPSIEVADSTGLAWMRITLTPQPVKDDFPWNGSVSEPNGYFQDGETEDYVVAVIPSTVDVGDGVPRGLWMAPLAPNPARLATTIRYTLPREADVALEAFDVNGRRVRRFAARRMPAGEHAQRWDFTDEAGRSLPPGIYMVKLSVDGEALTQRVIRVR